MNKKLLDRIFKNKQFMKYCDVVDQAGEDWDEKSNSKILFIEECIKANLAGDQQPICYHDDNFLCEHRIEYIKRAVIQLSEMTEEEIFTEVL